LSTINPGLVLGVPLDAQYGGSLEVVERLFTGADPTLPDLDIPIVDVADVAKMHRLVLEADAASGERFPAVAEALTMLEMGKILNGRCQPARPSSELLDQIHGVVRLRHAVCRSSARKTSDGVRGECGEEARYRVRASP
jgi:dihydroflavonol-4-reductase